MRIRSAHRETFEFEYLGGFETLFEKDLRERSGGIRCSFRIKIEGNIFKVVCTKKQLQTKFFENTIKRMILKYPGSYLTQSSLLRIPFYDTFYNLSVLYFKFKRSIFSKILLFETKKNNMLRILPSSLWIWLHSSLTGGNGGNGAHVHGERSGRDKGQAQPHHHQAYHLHSSGPRLRLQFKGL